MNSFNPIATPLVGPPREFPLEHRLFNFVALLNTVSNLGAPHPLRRNHRTRRNPLSHPAARKNPRQKKGEIEMFLVTAIRPGRSKDDTGTDPDGRFWQKHRQLT